MAFAATFVTIPSTLPIHHMQTAAIRINLWRIFFSLGSSSLIKMQFDSRKKCARFENSGWAHSQIAAQPISRSSAQAFSFSSHHDHAVHDHLFIYDWMSFFFFLTVFRLGGDVRDLIRFFFFFWLWIWGDALRKRQDLLEKFIEHSSHQLYDIRSNKQNIHSH